MCVTDSILAADSIDINGSGGDSKVLVALSGYKDAQYGVIYADTILINNADVILRTDKLISEGKLKESTIKKVVGYNE